MKKLLVGLFVLISATAFAYDDEIIDGHNYSNEEVVSWYGMNAPANSATNTARVYFDGASDKLMLSENGGAYSSLMTHTSAHAQYLAIKI